jgi:hypothetical protein
MTNSDRDREARLTWTLGIAFVVGLAVVVFVAAVAPRLTGTSNDAVHLVFAVLDRLGEALMIACIVGYAFERVLSDMRTKEILSMLLEHSRLQHFGFRDAYVSRQKVFDKILGGGIEQVEHSMDILGIGVSLFKEANRGTSRGVDSEKIIEQVADVLVRTRCSIRVLCLKREPSEAEVKAYGLGAGGSLHDMRENDEDTPSYVIRGRMRKIANRSIAAWINVYIQAAQKMKHRTVAERLETLQRLRIKEYLAMPALSLFIMDGEIMVTPYLYRRRCADVPSFRVGGQDSDLYRAYYGHFQRLWEDWRSTPAIPASFVEALARDPEKTISDYCVRHAEIKSETGVDRDVNDRSEELAVRMVVGAL